MRQQEEAIPSRRLVLATKGSRWFKSERKEDRVLSGWSAVLSSGGGSRETRVPGATELVCSPPLVRDGDEHVPQQQEPHQDQTPRTAPAPKYEPVSADSRRSGQVGSAATSHEALPWSS